MEENINNQTPTTASGQAVPQTPPPQAATVPPAVNPQPPVTPPAASSFDPKSNKTLIIVILGIVLVVTLGTIYVIAIGKNSTAKKTAAPSPVVEQPTATPNPTPSDDINSVEVPNPQDDIDAVTQDLNQL